MSAFDHRRSARVAIPEGLPRPRPMRLDDLAAIDAIERVIYEFPWTPGNFRDSLASGHDAPVFDGDAGIIAYAVLMWLPDEIHLLNLSVAAPWQRRGVGRAVLRWLVDDAAARGAPSMLLEVRPSNAAARALYRSEGFETIGERRRYYPSSGPVREDALVMRRTF